MSTTRVAVLFVVMPGRVGELVAAESLRSFALIEDGKRVRGVFWTDIDPLGARATLEDEARAILTTAGIPLAVVPAAAGTPVPCMDTAYTALRDAALTAGFTHGIVARSHEMFRCQADGQVVQQLPAAFAAHTDILQCVSNVANRPRVDVLCRLAAVRFVGPMLAAPVPLHKPVTASAWPGVSVAALAAPVAVTDALHWVAEIHSRMQEADTDGELHYLQRQLVHARHAAGLPIRHTLKIRLAHGIAGWGDVEGLYLARLWRATLAPSKTASKQLRELVEAANTGLELGRVEGACALSGFLRTTANARLLAAVVALGIETYIQPRRSFRTPAPGALLEHGGSRTWDVYAEVGAALRAAHPAASHAHPYLQAVTDATTPKDYPSAHAAFDGLRVPDDGLGARKAIASWATIQRAQPSFAWYDDLVVDAGAFDEVVFAPGRQVPFRWLLNVFRAITRVPLAWAHCTVYSGDIDYTAPVDEGIVAVLGLDEAAAGNVATYDNVTVPLHRGRLCVGNASRPIRVHTAEGSRFVLCALKPKDAASNE